MPTHTQPRGSKDPTTTVNDDLLTSSIASQYDRFQDSLEHLGKDRQYLNYGYTTSLGQTYEDRQEALCLEVFLAARVEAAHRIVDVGFGSGEQDFLWAERFAFEHLQGFNISRAQVEHANRRAKESEYAQRLHFSHGQAELLTGVEAASIDRLLAVECAFYFDRKRFYARAAEVLRPGGLLVAADISFARLAGPATWLGEDLRRVGTLVANQRLWERHFHTVNVRTIRPQVLPGVRMTIAEIRRTLSQSTFSDEQRSQWNSMAFWSRLVGLGLATRLLRYDIVVLERR